MVLQNGVKSIQAAAYNEMRSVIILYINKIPIALAADCTYMEFLTLQGNIKVNKKLRTFVSRTHYLQLKY